MKTTGNRRPLARRVLSRSKVELLKALGAARNTKKTFHRRRFERALAQVGADEPVVKPGPVLMDGQWDNSVYWLRLDMVRNALGTPARKEIGITGISNADKAAGTFRRLGAEDVVNLKEWFPERSALEAEAEAVLAACSSLEDLMAHDFPFGVPGYLVFDELQRLQKEFTVVLDHPKIREHMAECLGFIHAAKRIVDHHAPGTVILSHSLGVRYAPLALFGIQAGADVLLLYGERGAEYFARMTDDTYWDAATITEECLGVGDPERFETFVARGADYIGARMESRVRDYASTFAYVTDSATADKARVCEAYGWSAESPLVIVFATTWWDFPHLFGEGPFLDVADWLKAVHGAALERTDVNWLFKPHPLEAQFGDKRLADFLGRDFPPHIGFWRPDWDTKTAISVMDGGLTWTGSIGFEAPSNGKPTVAAMAGWNTNLDIQYYAESRQGYLDLLARDWWRERDLEAMRRMALAYVGAKFTMSPAFAKLDLPDNNVHETYRKQAVRILGNESIMRGCKDEIRSWFLSGNPSFKQYQLLELEPR